MSKHLRANHAMHFAKLAKAALGLRVVVLAIGCSVLGGSAAKAQTVQDNPFTMEEILGGLGDFPTTFDPLTYGEKEYRQSCAACHGEEGIGDGLIAGKITPAPPNLQHIAERAGGRFPLVRVYEIIDGREVLKAHDSPDMPIWGKRFNAEAESELQPKANRVMLEMITATRIMSLVFFLESIQTQATDSNE